MGALRSNVAWQLHPHSKSHQNCDTSREISHMVKITPNELEEFLLRRLPVGPEDYEAPLEQVQNPVMTAPSKTSSKAQILP